MDRFSSPLANRIAGSNAFGKVTANTGAVLGSYLGRPSAASARTTAAVGSQRGLAPRLAGTVQSGSFGSGFGSSRFSSVSAREQPWAARDAARYSGFQTSADILAAAQTGRDAAGGGQGMGGQPMPGSGGTAGARATYTPSFGQFQAGDEVLINQAATKAGIPPNILKAIIAQESSGDWNANNRYWNGRPEAGPLLPYVGVFQKTAYSRGLGNLWEQAAGNKGVQIEMLAYVLRQQYDQLKGENPSYGWENVAVYHYSGKRVADGWRDERGVSNQDYLNEFRQFMGILEPGGQGAGVAGGGVPQEVPATQQQTAAMASIWAGTGANPSLNYGFLAPNNLGLYGYGTAYGTDGRGHTGVDAGMPIGTPNYSPVSGTVVCACTNSGGGCGAFNDYMGKGCGRIEVKLDNGHRLILGHMSTSNVRIGDRVGPGMQLGTSGGMNGPHTHIEYRVPDPSQSSGFRLVDPAKYLGGGVVSGVPSTGGAAAPAGPRPMAWETRNYGYSAGPARTISGWRR